MDDEDSYAFLVLVTTLRPNVALELHHVAGGIDHHEGLMLVSAVGKSNCGAHQELGAQFLDMVFQPGKIFHAQERKAVMPRVCARIGHDRAPLPMTYQLQDAAEAERDAAAGPSEAVAVANSAIA